MAKNRELSEEFNEDRQGIPSYLRRLTKEPLLTPDEERELAFKVRAGCEKSKKRLIEANMRLVINIAKNYRSKSIPFEDLVQEGAIGLMNAVERFDPERGYRFSTYATHWIRQTIGRALDSKAKAIRVPTHVTERLRRLEKERSRLEKELGRDPSAEELAEAMGLPFKKLLLLLQSSQEPVSLDVMVGESETTDLMSLLPDTDCFDPENAVIVTEAFRCLLQIISTLSEREQAIMKKRLGLDGSYDRPNLRTVSDDMNLSRERIRQIEVQAIRRLRSIAQKRRLKDLFNP